MREGFAQVRAGFELNTKLQDLDLLEILKEREFQELVELASEICETPVSLISLLDEHKQWITSSVGIDLRETPRDVSFCTHAIRSRDLFVVEDATKDERFRENPFVTGEGGVRFYAGIPLCPPDGQPFGTLCVIDVKARTMSERERKTLEILGRQVQTRLELRAKHRKLEAAHEVNERLSATLRESNDLFLTFMQHLPMASFIKDSAGRMVFYNREMAERFGVDMEAWIGRTNHDLWPKEMADKICLDEARVLQGGVLTEINETSPDTHGGWINWRSYKFPFQNHRGDLMVAGMSLDVTADVRREQRLGEANRQLEVMARTDVLTGLPNRRVFEARAAEAFEEARKVGEPLSLLVLDVDDFKKRNDQLGHAAGDEALRQIAAMLAKQSVGRVLSARIGGEEFGILLPGMDSRAALGFAQEVRRSLVVLEAGSMTITGSIGVAALDATASDWQRLMARADDAMYDAKRRGKDQVVLHEDLVRRLLGEAEGVAARGSAKTDRVGRA